MTDDFFSNVDDSGHLQNNVRDQIAVCLKKYAGKRVHITIQKQSKRRSERQNAYYWKIVVRYQQDCFFERWGEQWTKDQVHEWNKSNVWNSEIIDPETGEIIKKPGSSAKQTTAEFELRLERLRQFFELNFDWRIPLPNEQIEFFE